MEAGKPAIGQFEGVYAYIAHVALLPICRLAYGLGNAFNIVEGPTAAQHPL